jgi:PmbA protein
MKGVLAKVKGKVEQAELFSLRSRTVPITFRAGRLEAVKTQEIEGQALRVVCDGRLGFSTSTDVKDPSRLIAAAIDAAAYGDKAEFSFPKVSLASRPSVYDRAVAKVAEEELIAIGEEAIRRLSEADPQATVNLSLVKEVEGVSIENTSGLEVEEERTRVSIAIEVEKAREGDIFILSKEALTPYLDELEPAALVARLIEELKWGERVAAVPSTKLPVVFTPNGALALLLSLLVGLNGKSVYMGTSPLKGRIGERVFDPRLSIADDGTIPRAVGSGAFDDEGTPTRHTPLVTDGVVNGFVYDLRTAALARTESTGNGRRGSPFGDGSFRAPPGVGTTNILLGAGETPEAELVAGIEEGLLVEAVLGLGQGNLASGDFSNNVAIAFKIEKGRVVGRVKNTMIAGNSYLLLKESLIGLGAEARWAHGVLKVPTIAVAGVSVVSAG